MFTQILALQLLQSLWKWILRFHCLLANEKVFGRKISKNKSELPWLGIIVIKCIIWHMWFNNNKWLVKDFFLSFLLLQRWSRKWWNFYQYDLISILSKEISTLDNISALISTDRTSKSTFSIARSAESHRLYSCVHDIRISRNGMPRLRNYCL